MPSANTVEYRSKNFIAMLTLDRAQTRNALNRQLLIDLRERIKTANGDPEVRVIVITGSGKGFCSGADLTDNGGAESKSVTDYLNEYYKPLIIEIDQSEKPVIAAVNGVAAGAGGAIVMACDVAIMAQDASLIQAFTNIGLIPDSGVSWFLSRCIGYKKAFELVACGEKLTAQECLDLGLANAVVSPDQLIEKTLEVAQKYASRPPLALKLSKKTLKYSMEQGLEPSIVYAHQLQNTAATSNDAREGINAFIEKRKPNYTGT